MVCIGVRFFYGVFCGMIPLEKINFFFFDVFFSRVRGARFGELF